MRKLGLDQLLDLHLIWETVRGGGSVLTTTAEIGAEDMSIMPSYANHHATLLSPPLRSPPP